MTKTNDRQGGLIGSSIEFDSLFDFDCTKKIATSNIDNTHNKL